jgi:hypothetical protein
MNINLLDLFHHSPTDEEKPTQKAHQHSNLEQPFAQIKTTGRIIAEYQGFLPCTHNTARHILRCEHLRHIQGEQRDPYKFEPNNTHQIWIWYRLCKNFHEINLLFHGQFNFAIPTPHNESSDEIAMKVTKFLVHIMSDCQIPAYVLRDKDSDTFWTIVVEKKLRNLCE